MSSYVPPVLLLFNEPHFNSTDFNQVLTALTMFAAPLEDSGDGALFNPLLHLSFYNHFQEWSSRNAPKFYKHVMHMIYNVHQVDPNSVLLSETIYDLNVSSLPATTLHISTDMRDTLVRWWHTSPAALLVCPCSIYNNTTNQGHNVCLLFQKNKSNNTLNYLFIEQYGEVVKQNINVHALLDAKLKHLFDPILVEEIPFVCPELQIDLGENCVQWQGLFITLFALTPTLFSTGALAQTLLYNLGVSPSLNILLFSLYMFMYICSVDPPFPSDILFQPINMLPMFYADIVFVQQKESLDSNVRDLIVNIFNIDPNDCCPSMSPPQIIQGLLYVEKYLIDRQLLPFVDAFGEAAGPMFSGAVGEAAGPMFPLDKWYRVKTPSQFVQEQKALQNYSSRDVKKVKRMFRKQGIVIE